MPSKQVSGQPSAPNPKPLANSKPYPTSVSSNPLTTTLKSSTLKSSTTPESTKLLTVAASSEKKTQKTPSIPARKSRILVPSLPFAKDPAKKLSLTASETQNVLKSKPLESKPVIDPPVEQVVVVATEDTDDTNVAEAEEGVLVIAEGTRKRRRGEDDDDEDDETKDEDSSFKRQSTEDTPLDNSKSTKEDVVEAKADTEPKKELDTNNSGRGRGRGYRGRGRGRGNDRGRGRGFHRGRGRGYQDWDRGNGYPDYGYDERRPHSPHGYHSPHPPPPPQYPYPPRRSPPHQGPVQDDTMRNMYEQLASLSRMVEEMRHQQRPS